MVKNNFDIIIIGAGVSGLILANEIMERTKKTVLMIERQKKITMNNNLCFWNFPSNLLTPQAENIWEDISIFIKGEKILLNNENFKYLMIKYKSLKDFFIKRLERKKRFKLFTNQEIKEIINTGDKISIKTNNKIFRSSLLFDSRRDIKNEPQNKLLQHFYGFEVIFNKKVMNKNEVVLMDILDRKDVFNFVYILPFSRNRALIELTYFSSKVLSKDDYKIELKRYIKNKFNNLHYNIKSHEYGVIPMFKYKQPKSVNHIKIGLAGNWAKQSTGYSLQNSFLYSKQLVDCIIKDKRPKIKERISSYFLDKIFCNFLNQNPVTTQLFFKCFFKKNSLRTLVRFLTNTANIFEIFKVIITLPKLHMIKSIFANK